MTLFQPLYRHDLPQLGDRLFLTDGGLETTLIFHDKIELPYFAAFDLLKSADGIQRIRDYYLPYIRTATDLGFGFILESSTWRAHTDWGARLGHDAASLAEMNRRGIALLADLRRDFQTPATRMVISGCIGPRGDGYDSGKQMTPAEAEAYHAAQIATFADTEADLVSAFTMTNTAEAIGIVRAAVKAKMPAVISFTLETDGKLPSGQTLRAAIEETDAATGGAAAYFMINCAHPTHFENVLQADAAWVKRLRGLRANASCRSHAELDAAPDLDSGNPAELGRQYADLRRKFPHLTVLGGCCGTDHRHVDAISQNCPARKAA
jgi:homocysteine S-methyltransferase